MESFETHCRHSVNSYESHRKRPTPKEPAVCYFCSYIRQEEYYFFATYFLISREIAM